MAIALIALLPACGGDEPAADDAGPRLTACELLTEAEVEAGLGGEDVASNGGRIVDATQSGCQYQGDAHTVTLVVTYGQAAETTFDDTRDAFADTVRPVADLGDDAFAGFDVFVLSGDALLQVTVLESGAGPDVDLATEFARQVVADL